MTAAIKYRLEAYSAKYRDVYRVDIFEEGYTGAMYRKNIGPGKLRLSKKEGVIQYTSLHISIQSDTNFEYIRFFQYNNRRFPVKLFKNDTQIWSGYIVAESYSEPYINPPYSVQLIATDGLGTLENYTFNNTGIQSRLDAIRHCIDNLGIELDYSIAVDLFDANMDTSKAMLAQNYFYGEIFADEDCATVIESLLPFECVITQINNKWVIRRPFEDAEKTHYVYDFEGTYSRTASGESTLVMGDLSSGGVWPHAPGPLLSMEHAWKSAEVTKDFGKKQSFLKNYNFNTGDTSNWTNATNINLYVGQINDEYYLRIPGYTDPGEYRYVEQAADVENTVNEGGNFIFECKYDVLAGLGSTSFAANSGITVTVRLKITLVGTTTTYYLTTSGWTETEEYIEIEFTSSVGSPNWKDLKIITDNIPVDGNLIVRLYRLEYATSVSPSSRPNIAGSCFTDVRIYTSLLDEYSGTETTTIAIRESAVETGNVELKPVDLPSLINSKAYFNNGNYYYNGSEYKLTGLWENNGANGLNIIEVLEAQLIQYYGSPRQILSGCNWRGVGLHLNAVAKHPANFERVFIADYGDWNILDDTWSIVWKEKPGSASGDSNWVLDSGLWDDSGEWLDDEGWKSVEDILITINLEYTGAFQVVDITGDTGISSGDIITSIPYRDQLLEGLIDVIEPGDLPYTFTGGILYYKFHLQSENYQNSFTAIIGGVEKTIKLMVTI